MNNPITASHLLFLNLSPIIETVEIKKLLTIELWKNFILDIDVSIINNTSGRQYRDGLDFYFTSYPYYLPNQRDMAVIASILVWLPSNCGKAFLADCEKFSKLHKCKERGYRNAWAEENARKVGFNNGLTCLEYLLTPIKYHDMYNGLNCDTSQFISVRDLECANYFMYWLSTTDGQSFLKVINDSVFNNITKEENDE